jgi:hypothetical protein
MLAANKTATVTIGFWANSTGWPVKVAVTGQSVTVHLAIGEALACNQRMSITEA